MTDTVSNSPEPAESTDPAPAKDAPSGSSVRVGAILKIVLPVFLLIVGAVAFFGFFDGVGWLQRMGRPPLVETTGQVIFQGKPLPNAQVMTRHTNPKLRGAVGFCDEEGRFKLQTDLDGKYHDGAFAGEHVVTVAAYGQNAPAAAPPLMSPPEYVSFGSTPLRLEVQRDASKNTVELKLEGEVPARGGGGGGRGGPGGGGPGGGAPPRDPDEIVDETFRDYDTDENDELSAEEIEKIEGMVQRGVQQADQDEDGVVTREEWRTAVEAFVNRREERPDRPQRPEPAEPDSPDAPPEPDAPSEPDAPGVSDAPPEPDSPPEPDAPPAPDAPGAPDAPSEPDAPPAPDAPESAEKPPEPDADSPDESEVPESPQEIREVEPET